MHKYSDPSLKHLYSLRYFGLWCNKLCSSACGNYLSFFSSPLHLSSSVRLDGDRHTFQVFPEIFEWVQVQALSCWKVHLLPSPRFWMLWTGFSLRRIIRCVLSFFSMCPSVLAAEKQPHSMSLLPAHFTFGMILCRWWSELVSFKYDA